MAVHGGATRSRGWRARHHGDSFGRRSRSGALDSQPGAPADGSLAQRQFSTVDDAQRDVVFVSVVLRRCGLGERRHGLWGHLFSIGGDVHERLMGTDGPTPPPNARPYPGVGLAGSLTSVSCGADGSCAAVGDYSSSLGSDNYDQSGLLEQLSDGVWTATEAPLPFGESGGLPNLNSVSCSDVANCVAVGSYWDGSNQYATSYTLKFGGVANEGPPRSCGHGPGRPVWIERGLMS